MGFSSAISGNGSHAVLLQVPEANTALMHSVKSKGHTDVNLVRLSEDAGCHLSSYESEAGQTGVKRKSLGTRLVTSPGPAIDDCGTACRKGIIVSGGLFILLGIALPFLVGFGYEEKLPAGIKAGVASIAIGFVMELICFVSRSEVKENKHKENLTIVSNCMAEVVEMSGPVDYESNCSAISKAFKNRVETEYCNNPEVQERLLNRLLMISAELLCDLCEKINGSESNEIDRIQMDTLVNTLVNTFMDKDTFHLTKNISGELPGSSYTGPGTTGKTLLKLSESTKSVRFKLDDTTGQDFGAGRFSQEADI